MALWRSLFRWILRRSPVPDSGTRAFGYTGVVLPIMLVFIILSTVELPILHLILPWQTVRYLALALGLYSLLWMIGLLASLRVHPHLVGERGLRIRNGISLDILLPWDAIGGLRARFRSQEPGRSVRTEETGSGTRLQIGVAKQISVEVTLRQPVAVPLSGGRMSEPVSEIWFYADEPDALVAYARSHLTAGAPPAGR
jgi:hypothetical protein